MNPHTLDSAEAAQLLKCSVDLVTEMARRGEIPATMVGGQWLFVTDQVMAHLKERARDEQAKRRETIRVLSVAPKAAPKAAPAKEAAPGAKRPGRPRRVPPVNVAPALLDGAADSGGQTATA